MTVTFKSLDHFCLGNKLLVVPKPTCPQESSGEGVGEMLGEKKKKKIFQDLTRPEELDIPKDRAWGSMF